MADILDFAGHMVSATTNHLSCSAETVMTICKQMDVSVSSCSLIYKKKMMLGDNSV